MRYTNITATCLIENRLVLKKSNFTKTVNTTSKKIYVEASAAKTTSKPLPRDKTPGLEPTILLYDIEDGDKNKEGEYAEIIGIQEWSLAVSTQNLVKIKFPNINTFDHEEPEVVRAMRDLTTVVFEHLEITSPMDLYQRFAYTQRILRGSVREYQNSYYRIL